MVRYPRTWRYTLIFRHEVKSHSHLCMYIRSRGKNGTLDIHSLTFLWCTNRNKDTSRSSSPQDDVIVLSDDEMEEATVADDDASSIDTGSLLPTPWWRPPEQAVRGGARAARQGYPGTTRGVTHWRRQAPAPQETQAESAAARPGCSEGRDGDECNQHNQCGTDHAQVYNGAERNRSIAASAANDAGLQGPDPDAPSSSSSAAAAATAASETAAAVPAATTQSRRPHCADAPTGAGLSDPDHAGTQCADHSKWSAPTRHGIEEWYPADAKLPAYYKSEWHRNCKHNIRSGFYHPYLSKPTTPSHHNLCKW